ncbi:MAG: TonB-dependent receptor [Gemmatimonadales bacterium]
MRGLAGVSFDNQHQESASSFGGFASPPFDAERDNWGFYLQASALPVRRLQVTAGGRLDQNERFGSFWTYRANALAFVAPGTRLRGSVGTGFREPAFFENFTTGFSTGNPDLEPERSFNLEGGVEQDLAGGRVGVSLTAFAQRFRDLIQYTPFPPSPGDPNFFNVPAANASGLEATLRVRPLPVLEGSLAYTHVATKVTDAGFDTDEAATFVQGRRLLRRPSHAFTARAEYAGAGRVRLGARVHWVGSRDDIRFAPFPEPSRRVELPAYTRVDLSGSLAVLRPGSGWRPGLELTARVENLFDEEYEQAAGYPSPGIALFVGARTRVH